MKFLITVFLSLLLATFVLTYSFPFFDNNSGKHCENPTFWKNFYDNVKKKHPTADTQDLQKFIANDLMNDSSNPMFATAQFFNENSTDYNSSQLTYYIQFYGTPSEMIHLFEHHMVYCEMENNFTLAIIPRNTKSKNKNFFSRLLNNNLFVTWWNSGREKKFPFESQIIKHLNLQRIGDPDSNCTKLPEIQAIIDKLGNMSISSVDEWVRLFTEELKISIKPRNSSVTKANAEDFMVSYVIEGDEKFGDDDHCFDQREDKKCKECEISDAVTVTLINYYEQ